MNSRFFLGRCRVAMRVGNMILVKVDRLISMYSSLRLYSGLQWHTPRILVMTGKI